MPIKPTSAKKSADVSLSTSLATSAAKPSARSKRSADLPASPAAPTEAPTTTRVSKKTKYSNSSNPANAVAPAKKPRRNKDVVVEQALDDSSRSDVGDISGGNDELPDALDVQMLSDVDTDFETLLATPPVGAKSSSSGRKPITPPPVLADGMNLLEYLHKCTPPLDKKIIDIACSQSNVFGELRKDVAQEVCLVWSQYLPDIRKYKPGQIASYAHRIAGHTALRVRRDLGSAVRLPGSAFRARADGSSYVTPGVLAQALDWNDIENWMLLDGAEASVNGISSISLEVEGVVKHLEESGEVTSDSEAEESSRSTRLQHLETKKQSLTERQYSILKAMIEGSRIDEIMEEHHIKKGLLLREIHIAMELMWPDS